MQDPHLNFNHYQVPSNRKNPLPIPSNRETSDIPPHPADYNYNYSAHFQRPSEKDKDKTNP